jgi:hypothetical protein
MPDLADETKEHFQCFSLCDSQVRAAMSAYALDWSIVLQVAQAMGLKPTYRFFLMLKAFENSMISEINRKQDAK